MRMREWECVFFVELLQLFVDQNSPKIANFLQFVDQIKYIFFFSFQNVVNLWLVVKIFVRASFYKLMLEWRDVN